MNDRPDLGQDAGYQLHFAQRNLKMTMGQAGAS
jgi:hypothetical protein